jgi:hypothetical protein
MAVVQENFGEDRLLELKLAADEGEHIFCFWSTFAVYSTYELAFR